MQRRFILSLLMLTITLSTYAYDFETGGIYYTILGYAGHECAVTYKTNSSYNGNIVIPPTVSYNGEEYTVKEIDYNAFENCVKLKSITLPNTIETINSSAFKGCILLKSISLPNSVKTLGQCVFSDCASLESIDLGHVTSIGEDCFTGCISIEKLTIPSSMTEMPNTLLNETSITTLTIEDGNTPLNVGFNKCPTLDSVYIGRDGPYFYDNKTSQKENTTNIRAAHISDCVKSLADYMFNHNTNLTNLDGCKNIEKLGSYCLHETGIKYFNGTNVKTIGIASISSCPNIETVVLGKIEDLTNTYFYSSPNLKAVYLGNELRSLGKNAFYNGTEGGFSGKVYIFSNKLSSFYTNTSSDGKTVSYAIPVTAETIYLPNTERLEGLIGATHNLKPLIEFKESEVEYTGKTPKLAYLNNVTGFDVTLDNATTPKDAGTYKTDIDVIFSKDGYEVSVEVPCTYTVTKAPLSIIANNVQRYYGEDNPEFSCSYVGFKNGETQDVLDKQTELYTTATKESNAGTYPIYCTGAESKNYTLNYMQGTLTINKAKQEIEWEQEFENTEVGDKIELTATSNSGLPVKYRSTDMTTAMVTSKNGKQYLYILKEGTVVLTAYQNGDTNHEEADEINKLVISQTSGIDKVSADEAFEIVDGKLILKSIENDTKIKITDLSGKSVLSTHVSTQDIVTLPNTMKGVYILKIGKRNYKIVF